MRKTMRCTFYRPEKINLTESENIIGKLRYDIGELGDKAIDDLSIYYYAMDLANKALPLDRCPGMCFWGFDEPKKMPSDARIDYFYRPTYLATAFLMKAVLLYPELLDENELCWEKGKECAETINRVLPMALDGCTGRGFQGHGHDSADGLLDAMEIFIKAGATEFVNKYPEMSLRFTKLYNEAMAFIQERVAEGEWCNGWGESYYERAKDVLKKEEE